MGRNRRFIVDYTYLCSSYLVLYLVAKRKYGAVGDVRKIIFIGLAFVLTLIIIGLFCVSSVVIEAILN